MSEAPSPSKDARNGRLFEALLSEIPFLYFRLKAVTQEVQGEGELSGARRSVLRSLSAGPATVPKLAAERPVARQVMQRLVNELSQEGFVEFVRNPGHQRSQLVRLTPQGERKLADMKARERDAASELLAGLSEAELDTTLAVVRTLSERLANIMEGHEAETPR